MACAGCQERGKIIRKHVDRAVRAGQRFLHSVGWASPPHESSVLRYRGMITDKDGNHHKITLTDRELRRLVE